MIKWVDLDIIRNQEEQERDHCLREEESSHDHGSSNDDSQTSSDCEVHGLNNHDDTGNGIFQRRTVLKNDKQQKKDAREIMSKL